MEDTAKIIVHVRVEVMSKRATCAFCHQNNASCFQSTNCPDIFICADCVLELSKHAS